MLISRNTIMLVLYFIQLITTTAINYVLEFHSFFVYFPLSQFLVDSYSSSCCRFVSLQPVQTSWAKRIWRYVRLRSNSQIFYASWRTMQHLEYRSAVYISIYENRVYVLKHQPFPLVAFKSLTRSKHTSGLRQGSIFSPSLRKVCKSCTWPRGSITNFNICLDSEL